MFYLGIKCESVIFSWNLLLLGNLSGILSALVSDSCWFARITAKERYVDLFIILVLLHLLTTANLYELGSLLL